MLSGPPPYKPPAMARIMRIVMQIFCRIHLPTDWTAPQPRRRTRARAQPGVPVTTSTPASSARSVSLPDPPPHRERSAQRGRAQAARESAQRLVRLLRQVARGLQDQGHGRALRTLRLVLLACSRSRCSLMYPCIMGCRGCAGGTCQS